MVGGAEQTRPTWDIYRQLRKSSWSLRSLALSSLCRDDLVSGVGFLVPSTTYISQVLFLNRQSTAFSRFSTSASIQVTNWRAMLSEKKGSSASATASASYLFLTKIPRNLPPIALMIIFGTARVFRARLYRAFWPKQWQRFDERTSLDTLSVIRSRTTMV